MNAMHLVIHALQKNRWEPPWYHQKELVQRITVIADRRWYTDEINRLPYFCRIRLSNYACTWWRWNTDG